MRATLCLLLVLLATPRSVPGAERITVKAWPLVYHAVDEEAGTENLEVAWPLIDLRTAADYDLWSLLRLFSRQERIAPRETRTSVLFDLAGWVLRDESRWRYWVAPLLWRGTAGTSSHAVLFPLYFGSRNADGRTRSHLFLVWRGERQFQRGERLYRRAFRAVLPFYWSKRQEVDGFATRERHVLLPLASWGEQHDRSDARDRDEWHRSALFLVRWRRERDTNRRENVTESEGRWMIWPLFSSRVGTKDLADSQRRSRTVARRALCSLVKFASRTLSEKDGTPVESSFAQRIFPLYFRGGRDHGEQGTYLVLFPFWWNLRQPNRMLQALVPLGARMRDGESRALNLLGLLFTRIENAEKGYTRHDLLFPCFMAKTGRDTAALRIWPFYSRHREDGKRVGGSVCWPLVRWEERSEATGARQQLPVFQGFAAMLTGISSPLPSGLLTRSVWPFFVGKRSGDGWSWWSFPAGGASHRSSPNVSSHSVQVGPAGFLYQGSAIADVDDSRPRAKAMVLGGAWATEQGEGVNAWRIAWLCSRSWRRAYDSSRERITETLATSFLPFYLGTSRREYDGGVSEPTRTATSKTVPMLLSVGKETEGASQASSLEILPFPGLETGLLHRRTRQDGSGESAVLDPLWTAERTSQGERHVSSAGGFAYRSAQDVCGFRERRLFYRLFRSEANSRRSTWELMPLADGMNSVRGERSFHLLGGLFGYEASPERTRIRLAYLPVFSRRRGVAEAAPVERARIHLEYGLKYLESRTPERAVVELALAEPAFGSDAALYEKLGDACAMVCHRGFGPDFLEKAAEDIKSFASNYPSSFQDELAGRPSPRDEFHARARAAYRKAQELGADSALLRRKLLRLDPLAALYEEAVAAFPDDFSLRFDHAASVGTHEAFRSLAERYPDSALVQLRVLTTAPDAPALVEQALAAAQLHDLPHYRPVYPSDPDLREDNSRRCLVFALAQMDALAGEFRREEQHARELHWRRRRFETALDWGVAPDSEWQRRATIHSFRAVHADLGTEAELIPYLQQAILDLKPKAEQDAWQREIRRLEREASYLTHWLVSVDEDAATPPRRIAGTFSERYVNLRTALGAEDGKTARCRATIHSPQARDALLHFGFDETARLLLNGEEIFSGRRRIAVCDEFAIPIRLRAGANRLEVLVGNRRLAWGFFLRIANPEGDPIEGLVSQPAWD